MKKKTDKKRSLQVTLDFPIQRCLNMPTKKAFAALEKISHQVNRARNIYARVGWAVEQLPERTVKGKDGADKSLPAGPSLVFAKYGVARDVCPEVSSTLVSAAVRGVQRVIKSKLPYDSVEKAYGLRFVWEALNTCWRNPPSFRAVRIPIQSQDAKWCYGGDGDARLVAECGDRCVIEVPIWSKKSGRKQTRLRLELDPQRDSELLRAIAKQQTKMGDSSLAVSRKGKWVLRLCVALPGGEQLDASKVAELRPALPKDSRPFLVTMPGGRKWSLGNGRVWLVQRIRLEARRKAIAANSREGVHGHGRKDFFRRIRPYSRRGRDLQDRFVKDAVNRLIRSLLLARVGKLLYYEPSKPLREKCWLGHNGLPFDWTHWLGYLSHKCAEAGIEFSESKITLSEVNGGGKGKTTTGLRRVRKAGNSGKGEVRRTRKSRKATRVS